MVLFISDVKKKIPDFIIHRKKHWPSWGELSDFRLPSATARGSVSRQKLLGNQSWSLAYSPLIDSIHMVFE